MSLILIIILVLLLCGGLAGNWGPYPNGGIGLLLLVLIILALTGRI